ncbi:DUF2138 family protein [Massilia sp. PAMC28688]|uniref:DUF2138 family protein n=1 Tax=Massilia sp. PAMC28688 TaxID=2861283 RepID=UPI001C62F285|nr:DUF2138 family protein [Massilia sp. PAMC28688]QYF93544.1 DUF2138 family protein [Massilia sp. PAMC28688]
MDKKKLGIIAAGAAVCVAGVVGYAAFGWKWMGRTTGLNLRLASPDALIVTKSLSSLPRDLLTIPLARDVLREDFVFYYEQHQDRLGLSGTLRRIAYEHQLGWGDQLIKMVLDEPAEVALWRDGDGTLKHFAIAVSRNSFTRLLEEGGKVALKDSQMTRAGEIRVDGDAVPVFALAYAYQRTMLFAAHGKRMVILSHPGMLFGGEDGKTLNSDNADAVINMLAAEGKKNASFRDQFQLAPGAVDGHSVAVKADYLSFGYQPFFGGLAAMRFDFKKGQWSTSALMDAAKLQAGGYDNGALWPALPHNPAACFALPADWAAMQPVLGNIDSALEGVATQFAGPAAVCWYGSSRLYSPLVIATRKKGSSDELLARLFDTAVGDSRRGDVKKTAGKGGATLWQRSAATPLGAQLPTMAIAGDTVLFSPDAALVERALAVGRKQAPAIADRLADSSRTVGLIAPSALSELIRKETFDALPSSREPVLRAAADVHLVPRLEALKKYPPYRLVLKSLPRSGASWQPVEWQALER